MPTDGSEFRDAMEKMGNEWVDEDGEYNEKFNKHVLHQIIVQSPVIENLDQQLQADRIIYLY